MDIDRYFAMMGLIIITALFLFVLSLLAWASYHMWSFLL